MMEKMGKMLTARIFAIVMCALACVSMWGCTNDTFEWKGRSYPYLAALVNDSLALLYNVREYQECTEGVGPLGYSDCVDGTDNYGLYLVNYREKKSVYWGDTIDYAVNIIRGFYRDSSVLFFKDNDKKFGFWKVGRKPDDAKNIRWNVHCEEFSESSVTRYRPWKNGGVLAINAKGCAYAVLDTATGNVDELPLDGEYAWLKECEDVTYLNGYIMCLWKSQYGDNQVKLLRDGLLVDSLDLKEYDAYVGEIFDGAVKWNGPLVQIYMSSIRASSRLFLHPLIFFKTLSPNYTFANYFPELWLDESTFIDSAENKLQYTSDDLIITKGTK